MIGEVFPGIWVGGELQRPQLSRRGHLYFQLVEKGAGDQLRASLGAVLFSRERQRVTRQLRAAGLELSEGQNLRCFGSLDFYAASGRLQLVVRDVDPMFSLGALEQRRRRTLEALQAAGLVEANAGLPLAEVPLDLAVITSRGSAGALDFLTTLRASGFGFRVRMLDVAVQGASAELEIAQALRRLDREVTSDRAEIDAYVLVRGGGSRSDLATFDSRRVAEAVARARRPVLTGLGHEIDQPIADRVAHRAFKTPTGVGEFLCQRVADSDFRLEQTVQRLALAAQRRLREARQQLERLGGALGASGRRAERLAARLEGLERALRREAFHLLDRSTLRTGELWRRMNALLTPRLVRLAAECEQRARDLAEASRRRVALSSQRIEAQARLSRQLSPQSVLRRGFSITRDSHGRAIRSTRTVRPGERISTEVVDGQFPSVIEKRQ